MYKFTRRPQALGAKTHHILSHHHGLRGIVGALDETDLQVIFYPLKLVSIFLPDIGLHLVPVRACDQHIATQRLRIENPICIRATAEHGDRLHRLPISDEMIG